MQPLLTLLSELALLSRTRAGIINGSPDAEIYMEEHKGQELEGILATLKSNSMFESYQKELLAAFEVNKNQEEQLKKQAEE